MLGKTEGVKKRNKFPRHKIFQIVDVNIKISNVE
jgi:hypothetical protein